MPRKEKTETAPAAEVKTEAAAEPFKESVAKTAAPAEKPVKKTAAKKAPAAKKTTKAKAETKTKDVKETAAVEPAEKPVKKTAAKAKTTAPKEVVKLQFGSDEFDIAEIKKAVDADRKGKFKGRIKSLEIYIKPEEKAAYYVINSDFSDKIDL